MNAYRYSAFSNTAAITDIVEYMRRIGVDYSSRKLREAVSESISDENILASIENKLAHIESTEDYWDKAYIIGEEISDNKLAIDTRQAESYIRKTYAEMD